MIRTGDPHPGLVRIRQAKAINTTNTTYMEMLCLLCLYPILAGTMRTPVIDAAAPLSSDELLTTGEAAKILGGSRQHIVDLCDRGLLPFTYAGTKHRRIRRGDLEDFRSGSDRLSRDQQRSLWLAYGTAGRIVANPDAARSVALREIDKMDAVARGQARAWLDEWRRLLAGPLPLLLDALTDRSLRGRELRQNNPFTGLLSNDERSRTLDAWRTQRDGTQ